MTALHSSDISSTGGSPMTTLTAAPVSADAYPSLGWIRPWYPAGHVGHTDVDCPDLRRWVSDPQEGPGWLDPQGKNVCHPCVKTSHPELYRELPSWDAVCETCDASMGEEYVDDEGPFDEKTAEDWKRDHECEPVVRLVPPTTKKDAAA